jgi:serine/threonine protein kinase
MTIIESGFLTAGVISDSRSSRSWLHYCYMSSKGVAKKKPGDILFDKYEVTRRIGAGSFGAILEVQNLEDGKLYALKLENRKMGSSQLENEYEIYKLLGNAPGFPNVYGFWSEPTLRAMAMDRLGQSLAFLSRKSGKILSLKTVLMVGLQMLCRLEYFHQRSYVHRDIKPDNFVFGVGTNSNLLYLIDMGLAKPYRDVRSLVHFDYAEDQGLAGTARYVSINVHLGMQQSCRDDLESVGYVLISLLKGRLPWQDLDQKQQENYEQLSRVKIETSQEVLCEGLPGEFFHYMHKVRNLRYDERPPYGYLRGLFITLMVKNNFAFDYQYDWVVSRRDRLNSALRRTQDPSTVIIGLSQDELIGAEQAKHGKVVFWEPLPFFAILNEVEMFIAMSKRSQGDSVSHGQVQDQGPGPGQEHEHEHEHGHCDEAGNEHEGDPDHATGGEDEAGVLEFPKEQTMFLLDPRHTHLD